LSKKKVKDNFWGLSRNEKKDDILIKKMKKNSGAKKQKVGDSVFLFKSRKLSCRIISDIIYPTQWES
jgi:hypothetical protein